MRRTFATDVFSCPRCTGPSRVLAAIHEPTEARRFLTSISQLSIPADLSPNHHAADDDESHALPSDADEFLDAVPSSVPDPPVPDD